jgi:ppGpp synthetase/RelA/SpoT-type nucleotidyltranferase
MQGTGKPRVDGAGASTVGSDRWLQEQINRYKAELPAYREYAGFLEAVLKAAARRIVPLAIVQARPKSIASFAEKAWRKTDKTDPVNQFTDLCGARVIVNTQREVLRFCEFVEENFRIDEKNSEDAGSRLGIAEFGYLSVHYIVQVKADSILEIPTPARIKYGNHKAEIQVRTLLQHAWADISHDRVYKSSFDVPSRWKRESARLAALLEDADSAFDRLVEGVDAYAVNYGAYMSEDMMNREIATLTMILDSEEDEESRADTALRLARIAKAAGNWRIIVRQVPPLLDRATRARRALLAELGHAHCHLFESSPDSDGFRLGQEFLREVARPDDGGVPGLFGLWSCCVGDIQKPALFVSELTNPDNSVSVELLSGFAPETRDLLALHTPGREPSDRLLLSLVNELTSLVYGGCLADNAVFARITMRPATRALLKTQPTEDDLRRLNRMILEDAYPDFIVQLDALRRSAADETRTQALAWLAWSYAKTGSGMPFARELARQAHLSAPDNPYHLATFIEHEINCRSSTACVKMMHHTLRSAIQKCQEHADARTEVPWAYFTMGKLHLLLDEPYESLAAYARGIAVCVSDRPVVPVDIFATERKFLERVNCRGSFIKGLDWADLLLYLGEFAWLNSFMQFSATDLRDIAQLADRLLRSSDPEAQYLKGELSNETLNLLDAPNISDDNREKLRRVLVRDLNRLLKKARLYKEAAFAEAANQPNVRAFLDPEPQGTELMSVNRLILERAFKPALGSVWQERYKHWHAASVSIGELAEQHHLTADAPLKAPITIVAGGADRSVDTEMQDYRDHIFAVLEGYRGTVISGGTTVGIPGCVGSVTQELRAAAPKTYELIAYLPDHLPGGDRRFDVYTERRAGEQGFTALQPLVNWMDIVLSRIPPDEVTVLGINGGQIAAFEYQLALAMGAVVGLVENSGRSANLMLQSPDWANAKNLACLPGDAMTSRVFVQTDRQSISGGPVGSLVEAIARAIHSAYVADNQVPDPALAPWSKLDEGFKKSNRQQAVYMEEILRRCRLGVRKGGGGVPDEFYAGLEDMAEMEHGRYVAERLREGWKRGAERDPVKKTHPSLVSWKDLKEPYQTRTRNAVRQWPDILKRNGLEIFPLEQNAGSA